MSDRVGLTSALSAAVAPTRQRRSAHDPGVMLRDLVVMLADGGDCLADLGALRDQIELPGNVASDSTAFRVIDAIDEQCLGRLRCAVALSRVRAWRLGARPERSLARWQSRPERTVLDIDATLRTAHSEKEHAHGNFKRGYGHHPLLCYLDATGEAPAGILRPGNAGSNTAADHKAVLDLALAQLDPQALRGEILVRRRRRGRDARADRVLPRGRDPVLVLVRPRRACARGDRPRARIRECLSPRRKPDISAVGPAGTWDPVSVINNAAPEDKELKYQIASANGGFCWRLFPPNRVCER